MEHTVDINIPVEADAAAALNTEQAREAIGRVVSRILRPTATDDPLLTAMERLSADAARRGLTQAVLDEELAAHNAKRREPGAIPD